MKTLVGLSILTALLGVVFTADLRAQPSTFTYQGRLTENTLPYSGDAEFQFTLWDAASGGAVVATNDPALLIAPVSDGLFTVELDLGGAVFDGSERFLQIEVRTKIGSFTMLSPRQPISPTPQAIHSAKAAVATTAMTVDTGMISNPSFIGTTGTRPLDLHVNNERGLRLESTDSTPNIIGGFSGNSVGIGSDGAVIAGGGSSPIGGEGDLSNGIGTNSAYSAIGGGRHNTIRDNSPFATIGGGDLNLIADDAEGVTIAGGDINRVYSPFGTIAGGSQNNIAAASRAATIAGGSSNDIGTDSQTSVIGGGSVNTIGDNSNISTIGGGAQNDIGANSEASTIGGGLSNEIESDSVYSTIPGGIHNSVRASYAFAAGRGANANHTGAFVWADSQSGDFASIQPNEFAIHAENGVRILNRGNGAKLLRLDIERAWEFRQFSSGAGTALELGTVETTNPKNFIIRANAVGINTTAPTHLLHVNGVTRSAQSTWATSSDRRAKYNISTLEGSLERVACLRPVSFEYTPEYTAGHEGYDGRFTGFIAQEVETVFPDLVETVHEKIGDREVDDFRLLNAGGLTPHLVAAIKKLNTGSQRSEASIRNLEQQLQQKETEITELRRRLERLEELLNAKLNPFRATVAEATGRRSQAQQESPLERDGEPAAPTAGGGSAAFGLSSSL